MDINAILQQLGVSTLQSCREVFGGRDSRVYKIIAKPDVTYALRLLPNRKGSQYDREKHLMDIAKEQKVPVPHIHSITEHDQCTSMLMDWVEGNTILAELENHPESAYQIGLQFGQVHALIHRIEQPSDYKSSMDWLTPSKQEANILAIIPQEKVTPRLIHLDYHPLNVLTDGEHITGVIDWNNASFGDIRLDIARTYSIIQLNGKNHFRHKPNVMAQFQKGWMDGYEKFGTSISSMQNLKLFNAWAGQRMLRDLDNHLSEQQQAEIEKWISQFL
ncbi:phosphotransferase family protein [Salinibacillus xinjiangensis]|uniref:Phosphotransferase n=1 Tax=Salinibacillus xinjiangensis TaxID=1229268 RepID=A0A6G1X526_9BACI|nr:aminoglycoside 3'-phosphotransferase/choline kinase family protein [Salinibacillus xinjiangensis]MRG86101.1 phosphotransferase [Salinibacillus xinjiangensis]